MLVEELQDSLVATLILLLDLGILQVRTGSHPAVDLGREGLHVVGDLQVGLERLNILRGLILGREHHEGHVDALGVVGVDHGGVSLSGGLEELVVGTSGQSSNLATPAEAQNGPLETATGGLFVGLGDDVGDLGEGLGRSRLGREELSQLLLVLIGGGRVPGDVGRLALEEVGHEDAVLLLVGGGQDVGALDGLVEEAEDV